MPEPGRMDRTILRLPLIRGAVFLLFVSSAWAVGYDFARGYRYQSAVALIVMLSCFLLLAWTFRDPLGGPRAFDEPLPEDTPPPGASRSWPKHLFKIEQDKALHRVQSVLSQRADRPEAPLAIWRREMDDLQDYVKDRCGALGMPCPPDLEDRVIWSDRQSLLAKDYASSMALHLARIVERAGGAVD